MTLYFAYGSNLNIDQMLRRCPAAERIGKLYLPKYRLIFRGVADVVPDDDYAVPGGLWSLSPACEQALDRYEGWRPDNCGMYRKVYVEVDGLPDGETDLMMYVMNSTGICPPSIGYYNGIREGYQHFGLRVAALKIALKHSHDAKRLSHVERRRLRRNGRPTLKADPRVKPAKLPVRDAVADEARAANKARSDREASRWTEIKARAREADRASAELKKRSAVNWLAGTPAEIAKRMRSNKLSDWLEAQKHSGNRF
jgi:gamma-glutamylcyclotransferase (GGCT)/AIG2-like uncharacterized protein YtfP